MSLPDWPTLDEDTFEAIFQLIPCSDGDLNWARDEIYEAGIPDRRVWTIIEGDEVDTLWCLAGWHSTNVFGYAVSTVSWEDARTEGEYMHADTQPTCDICGEEERNVSGDEWCSECGTCRECCGHLKPCESWFMAGATCILPVGHEGSHRSGEE